MDLTINFTDFRQVVDLYKFCEGKNLTIKRNYTTLLKNAILNKTILPTDKYTDRLQNDMNEAIWIILGDLRDKNKENSKAEISEIRKFRDELSEANYLCHCKDDECIGDCGTLWCGCIDVCRRRHE